MYQQDAVCLQPDRRNFTQADDADDPTMRATHCRSREPFPLTAACASIALCAGLGFWGTFPSWAQGPQQGMFPSPESLPTEAPPGGQYVGGATCIGCHPAEGKRQKLAPMAITLQSAAQSEILRTRPQLTFEIGPYTYQILRKGDRSIYTVTDGKNTISEPIHWAFGLGHAGQTYVLRHRGSYWESRVSFYNEIQALDLTLGAPPTPPESLEKAVGREISRAEAGLCFGCHATAAVGESGLQIEQLTPGVTCEGCHGPGGKHVAALQKGKRTEAPSQILNPGRFSTEGVSDFCGSCHRTWAQVMIAGVKGVSNVRFQPYRLTNSRCYDSADNRISCLACHNPHEEVRRDPAFYDSKCLDCHLTKSGNKPRPQRVATACRVGTKRCVTCHMPKYEIPGSHFKFSDHQIRVVKPNEPYPN
jgi:Cytochrome c3